MLRLSIVRAWVFADMIVADVAKRVVAALQASDFTAAERLCRSALRLSPDAPELLFLLGGCLREQGRAKAALEPFSRLVAVCPEDATHWSNYAAVLTLAGDVEAAVSAAETAAHLMPDDPEKLQRLGLLRLQCGRPVEARDALLRAHELAPTRVDIRLHAARACIACHDRLADRFLAGWRTWSPLREEEQRVLATLLVEVGEVGDAVALLEDVVQHAPTDWSSALLLAKAYERLNRIGHARDLLDSVASAAPGDDAAVAHELATQRARLAIRSHDFATARVTLERAGAWGRADAEYSFALAEACDGSGDAAAAMRALATAHAQQIGELRISNPDLLEPDTVLPPHVADRVTAAAYHGWPRLRAPDAGQSPVFVVGFPRSGTTLLEQMLDAHPSLQSMDERPFLDQLASQLEDVDVEVPDGLHRLNQRDCDELRKAYVLMACGKVARNWRTRLVDKNPLNMLWLPLLHRLFPQARIILAVRHPCDVILSCYMQNFRSPILAAMGQSLERLSRAYVAVMDNWMHHAALFNADVMVVRYENLVAAPSVWAERIARFLDLGDAAAMLRFAEQAREKGYIRTPSYSKVVEPIDRRAVGRWQGYRRYFEPVLPILAPMLGHWGYAVEAQLHSPAANHGHQ